MKPIGDFHPDVQIVYGTDEHTDPIGILALRYDYLQEDNNATMVTCWRVSWMDLFRMLFTRKLWLVVRGEKFPPLFIETDKEFTGVDLA